MLYTGRQRKRYSEAFKHKVIVKALTSGKMLAEVATSNDVTPGLVTEWKNAFVNGEESKGLVRASKVIEEKDKMIETLMKKVGKQSRLSLQVEQQPLKGKMSQM